MNEESPKLKYLLDNLVELFHEKTGDGVDKLSNSTQEFLDEAGNLLRKGGNTIKTMFDYEKDEVKDNLREVFPQFMLLVESENS